MRLLITFTLFTICITAIGQVFPVKQKKLSYYPSTYIDTESIYTDSTGMAMIIQNSVRKAGGSLDATGEKGYTDSTGKKFGYAIFWTRVINETATPLNLTIHFPADSFTVISSPGSYIKLFLPSDTMTVAKESLYNYGASGIKSFLDTNFNKPTRLHRTINFKEDHLFYIAVLTRHPASVQRLELVLKERNLFYSVSIVGQLDPVLIPCGQVVVKN
jgi:hypothetical protein